MDRVIITGISRGIGKSTAEKFLDGNWEVVGTSTGGDSPLEHQHLKVLKLDLSDPLSIENFVSTISISSSLINVLINNAAISIDKSNNITTDVLRKTLEVNLIGIIDLTEKLLPFIKDNSHIINISSGAGSLTEFLGSYSPSYQISKTALNMYTRTLADRLKNKNIIVSSVNPGWVRTDMGGPNATRDPSEPAKEIYELATSKVDSGQFWYQGKKINW